LCFWFCEFLIFLLSCFIIFICFRLLPLLFLSLPRFALAISYSIHYFYNAAMLFFFSHLAHTLFFSSAPALYFGSLFLFGILRHSLYFGLSGTVLLIVFLFYSALSLTLHTLSLPFSFPIRLFSYIPICARYYTLSFYLSLSFSFYYTLSFYLYSAILFYFDV
jgi:hypothetical protein